jgi:hypothetical protein
MDGHLDSISPLTISNAAKNFFVYVSERGFIGYISRGRIAGL